jgi:hypothetical protein
VVQADEFGREEEEEKEEEGYNQTGMPSVM